MGEKLPRIVGLSFEVWREFLVDTNHGVAIDSWDSLNGGGAEKKHRIEIVIDWLKYCNHRRLHSTQNYLSLIKFEQNWLVAHANKTHN